MKTGRSLVELAQEIERQSATKKDYLAQTGHIRLQAQEGQGVQLRLGEDEAFGVNDLTHRQVGEYTDIPAKYYDKLLREEPALLAQNVNTWLGRKQEPRLVRTLDGNARAFLSDRYRPLEHADLAQAVLPPLFDLGVEIMSCEITERRLYIKAIDGRVRKEIPTGKTWGDGSHHIFDTVSPAIIISNSEVGLGALSVECGVYTKVCTNLAVFGQRSMKKYHVGGRNELDGLYDLLSDRTKKVTDAALWSQIGDVVRGAFEVAKFEASIEEMKGLTEQKIEGDPVKAIELTAKKFAFTEAEKGSVLRHLIEGGDLSRYGVFNAVTRAAQDLDDYDRATEFERTGGKIIELDKSEWRRIAEAA